MTQYLFTILLTATLTFCLAWGVWRLSIRFKLYPGIRERDVHKTPTPRLGGIAVYLAIMAVIFVTAANPFFRVPWDRPNALLSIVAASTLIVIVGIADDLWDLDWMIKLAAQFLAAGLITLWGGLQIQSLPIGGLLIGSSWMSAALTMLVLVVAMNALNFIDGLDGLVTGVALISNTVFFAYSYLVSRDTGANSYFTLSSLLAALLIGACVGFLPLNWKPAKLFIGDSGALLLGLLMATSAVTMTGQFDPAQLSLDEFGRSQLIGTLMPVLVIVLLLLPLTDFGLAVVRRLRAGKSPFSPDRKHLHHRMLDHGHSDRDAVLIFYAWTAVLCLAMLLMYIGTRDGWPGNYWPGILFGIVGSVACLVVTILPERGRSPRRPAPTHRKTPV